MQDEVNEKTIALCVQCGRMTAGVLKAAMRKYLNGAERHKQKKVQRRQAVKNGRAQERSRAKERRKLEKAASRETDDEAADGERRPAYEYSDHG